MRAVILTLVSAVAYGISFPPLALRPLAWVALVPWLVAVRSTTLSRAMLLGALWACAMTYVTSDCLPGAVVNYYQQPVWIGWLMLLGATVITMVPYYSSFAGAYWILSRSFPWARPLLAGAAWVGAELLRVKVLGGNPWAVSGYSQVGFLPLMQIADLGGVHAMSFVVVVVNAALADLWLLRRDAPIVRRRAMVGSLLAAALVASAMLYGWIRLRTLPAEVARSTPVAIAVLQANLDLGTQWRADLYGENLDAYLKLTQDVLRTNRPPALVFWPESAMTFFLSDEPVFRSAIARVLHPANAQLVAGGPRVEHTDHGAPRYFNSTFLLAPGGELIAWQDKTKLLPFAEYFPLQRLDLLRRSFGRARQFSPGEPRAPLPSVAGNVGVVVCNEAMYPEPARDRVAAGAEILVSPSNDSWFGSLKYSLQAFDITRLRAVEQRRYLVRASTAGPSAIFDPLGRVTAQTEPFAQAWLSGEVRPMQAISVYHSIGDAFAVACGIVALAAVTAALLGRGHRG